MKTALNRISRTILLLFFSWTVCLSGGSEELGRIVATVNNEIITAKDLADYCAMVAYRLSARDPDFDCASGSSQKKALNRLIEDKLILAEAKQEDLEVPQEWLDEKYEEVLASYPTRQEFEKSLIERGLTVRSLKDKIREQFLTQMILEKRIRVTISVAPPEIAAYYEQFKDSFFSPETYVFWIGKAADVPRLADMSESEYKDALNRIEAPLSELKEEIAGPLSRLKPKKSEIFTMDGQEYIVYLEKIIPEKKIPIDKVREKIKDVIWQEKFDRKFEDWLSELKKDAVIKIYE